MDCLWDRLVEAHLADSLGPWLRRGLGATIGHLMHARAEIGDVEIDDLADHHIDGKDVRDMLLKFRRPPQIRSRVGQKSAKLAGKCGYVSRWHQGYGNVGHYFGDAPDIGRDDGHLRGRCLQENVGCLLYTSDAADD